MQCPTETSPHGFTKFSRIKNVEIVYDQISNNLKLEPMPYFHEPVGNFTTTYEPQLNITIQPLDTSETIKTKLQEFEKLQNIPISMKFYN